MDSQHTAESLMLTVQSRQAGVTSAQYGRDLCAAGDAFIRTGLASHTVPDRRARFGVNKIALPELESYLDRLKEGMEDPTLRLLSASAVFSFVLGVIQGGEHAGIEGMSIVLTVVVVLNVQAFTNYRKAYEFRKQHETLENAKSVSVLRDGEMKTLHPSELVVGDVIRIKVGMVIPADGIVCQGSAEMDESAITGESKLIPKSIDSIVLSGTNVIRGEGLVLILAVGKYSVSGNILNTIVEDNSDSKSVLFEKLDRLANQIGYMGMAMSFVVFVSLCFTWIRGSYYCTAGCPPRLTWMQSIERLLEYFITALTVLVVAVPEGLPVAVTLSLAISLNRLLKDNNQVKNFDSCETMGSATTICSDKTGTLTENRMKVLRTCFDNEQRQSTLHENTQSFFSSASTPREYFYLCCVLATSPDTKVTRDKTNANIFAYAGNPTECAIIRYCMTDLDINYEQIQTHYRVPETGLKWGVHVNPFSSDRKLMSIVISHLGEHIMLCKGAPLILLGKCTSYFDANSGERKDMTSERKLQIEQDVRSEEDKACRVIACAMRRNVPENDFAREGDFTFLGWVAMEDPLRPGVAEAVSMCQNAGVTVRMLTGDSLATAVAVAKSAGILPKKFSIEDSSDVLVMTGAEFDELVHEKVLDEDVPPIMRRCYDFERKFDYVGLGRPFKLNESGKKILKEKEFDEIWPRLRVLARCEPGDKYALVKGMRRSTLHLRNDNIRAQVVAVTGDGTNDAPSLKAADVGFAMGIAGTDVAKQAADIIILDDSFNSIVRALVWGRNVSDSVCKFLQFQMTVNIVAVVIASVGSIALSRSPLTATQMLWVNMIMDSLGSLALATATPNEDEVLNRPPVNRLDPVITSEMWVNIVGQAVLQIVFFFLFMKIRNDDTVLYNTLVFNTFVLFQLFNEINCRTTVSSIAERFAVSGDMFALVWVCTFLIQIWIVQYGGSIFACQPLSILQWVFCIVCALSVIPWQIYVVDPVAKKASSYYYNQAVQPQRRKSSTITNATSVSVVSPSESRRESVTAKPVESTRRVSFVAPEPNGIPPRRPSSIVKNGTESSTSRRASFVPENGITSSEPTTNGIPFRRPSSIVKNAMESITRGVSFTSSNESTASRRPSSTVKNAAEPSTSRRASFVPENGSAVLTPSGQDAAQRRRGSSTVL